MGARWGAQVYALKIPLGYMNLQIVHLEMLNILAALRVWQDPWRNSKVAIACDNLAVVQVLNSGKTRDLTLAAIARNIQFQIATMNVILKITHIPGKVMLLHMFSLCGIVLSTPRQPYISFCPLIPGLKSMIHTYT